MTTTVVQGDYDNILSGYSRHSFYLAALKPKTLWTAQVTSSAARGTIAITFDTGTGLDFNAIEAPQTLWVGSSLGKKDLGVLRIRSVSSGDSGVTGTANVAWHGYGFGPGAFLSFVHDYPITAKYPWLGQTGVMGTTEVFYKDVFDTYNDNTKASNIRPVADVDISHRAGFLENGEQTFWVDASPSYSMISGVTISSYALSVYPTAGVTVTFNTSTGQGYVVVTSATEDYYWLKFTITDSNANTRDLYMCVFSFDPVEANGNYPIKDFELGQFTDDFETGGLTTRVNMGAELTQIFTGDRPSVDMIDTAFSVLWKETIMGSQYKGYRSMPRTRSDNHLFVVPDITVSVSSSATCDIDTTFVSGVLIDNAVPIDTTLIGLHVQVNAETPIAVNGTVTDGIVVATPPTINALLGACTGGTLKWLYSGNVIAQTELWSGKVEQGSSIYPSSFLAHPFNMLVGYLRESEVDEDTEKQSGTHDYELSSGDSILKNNYMYSIPIDSRENQSKWHHYHSNMTTAEAAMFVMDFHSNVLETVPVVGLDKDTDLRPYGEFQGQNLYAMVDGIIKNEGIRAHFKFDRHGKMHLVYDVQLLLDSERSPLPVASDVDISYRSGELTISEKPEPNAALVYGSGIFWDGSFDGDGEVGNDQVEAYCSLAPWYIPNWGGGAATTNFERQTVRSQAHMNSLTGRSYAKINNQFPRITHAWRGDFLGVLNMHFEEFWTITIQTTDNPKNLVFVDENLILRSLECAIDVANGAMTLNTTWEPEAAGLDGVTAVCPEIEIDIGGLPPFDWSEVTLLPGTIVTGS